MVTKRLEMEQTYLYDISVQDRHAVGIVVTVPEQELEIIQIRCKKGMLLCGIFHPDVVEKIRVPAGILPRTERAASSSINAANSGRNSSTCRKNSSAEVLATRETILNSSLWRLTTEQVCLPMDPVLPIREMLFNAAPPLSTKSTRPEKREVLL